MSAPVYVAEIRHEEVYLRQMLYNMNCLYLWYFLQDNVYFCISDIFCGIPFTSAASMISFAGYRSFLLHLWYLLLDIVYFCCISDIFCRISFISAASLIFFAGYRLFLRHLWYFLLDISYFLPKKGKKQSHFLLLELTKFYERSLDKIINKNGAKF